MRVLNGVPADSERQVSRALAGDPELLGAMPEPAEPHQAWSTAIVAALWPALWGHAADDIWAVTDGGEDLRADVWAAGAMFPEVRSRRSESAASLTAPSRDRTGTVGAADGDPPVERALVSRCCRCAIASGTQLSSAATPSEPPSSS